MNKTRFVPEGFKKDNITSYVGGDRKDLFEVYTNLEQPHNPRAMFFVGKQSSPIWHYRFPTVVEMNKKIQTTIENIMSHEDAKAKRKIEKMEARKNLDTSSVRVGDIFHWSGGYNCTRNSYVKVVMVGVGKNKVSVTELPKTQVDGDWMNGNVAPVVEFEGKDFFTFLMRPSYGGGVMLRDTRSRYGKENYYKWDGKPNWENCD